MKYSMTSPCDQCPFLNNAQMKRGFSIRRLREFASGEFPCHQTADGDSGEFIATDKSVHCAGALIFNDGGYDLRKLDMNAPVR